jgi:hypothetical protein
MSKVKNVTMGSSDIHPVVLATTGLSTCIAVVIVTDSCGVFLSHVSPTSFMDIRIPVIYRAQQFIEFVIQKLFKNSPGITISDVYLIGGINNSRYKLFNEAIEKLRTNPAIVTTATNVNISQLTAFLSCIKLNMIGFNVRKQLATTDNNDSDCENFSDNENDYLFDITLMCDMGSNPQMITVLQYGGTEKELDGDRSHIAPMAIYKINLETNNITVVIHRWAWNTPHYDKETIH